MPKDIVDYKPDIAGTNKGMTSPEMVALMKAVAERGMEYARSISPRRTGEYEASFRIETETHGGPRHNRAEARLINDSDHAVDVEFVNENGRVLGHTVDYIENHGA